MDRKYLLRWRIQDTRHPLLRYGAALLAVMVALPLQFVLWRLSLRSPFALFFAAVMFSAWYGGLGPGLLATALSTLATNYFLLPPIGSVLIRREDVFPVVVFVSVSVLISLLNQSRRHAEATAREQREWLRTTLTSIGDAVIATDPQGRVTFMNDVAQALTGWQEEQALGRDLQEVFPIVNETTREPVDDPVAKVRRADTVVGLANHTILIGKDGREIPIDDSGAPIKNALGELIGVVLVFRDISDRRRAEEALRFLAEASNVLASSLDYSETLTRVANLAVPYLADWCALDIVEEEGEFRRLAVAHRDASKVELVQEVQRRYPLDLRSPDGRAMVLRSGQPEIYPEISDALLAAGAQEQEHLAVLQSLGLKSAMILPLIAHGRTLGTISFAAAESGRRFGAADLVVAEELARRAAVAVDNARLYHEARQALQTRDTFLSIAAHELRTPLTTVLGSTQLLQRRAASSDHYTLTERDRRSLRVMDQQIQRLNRLMESLLDLSRIQAGRFSLEREPTDLCALAQRVVEEVQLTLDTHTLQLSCSDTPLIVDGDELRLEQVLQNLVSNAVKYSPDGGPITVSIDRANGCARLMVRDQGIGIPQAGLDLVFQRFYRASNVEAPSANVESRPITGMGIGLFVVKEIVTLHGGTVEVTSVEGGGSTFSVRLPLGESTEDNEAQAVSSTLSTP